MENKETLNSQERLVKNLIKKGVKVVVDSYPIKRDAIEYEEIGTRSYIATNDETSIFIATNTNNAILSLKNGKILDGEVKALLTKEDLHSMILTLDSTLRDITVEDEIRRGVHGSEPPEDFIDKLEE